MGAVSGTVCPHYRALMYMYRLPEGSLFSHCLTSVCRSRSQSARWPSCRLVADRSRFSSKSGPTLGPVRPTQPPLQWLPGHSVAKAAGASSLPLISIKCRGWECWELCLPLPNAFITWRWIVQRENLPFTGLAELCNESGAHVSTYSFVNQ